MFSQLVVLIATLCAFFSHSVNAEWQKANTTSHDWVSVSADSHGKNLVAVSYTVGEEETGVYISHDYGQNWQNVFINGCIINDYWMGSAIDSSGTTMYSVGSQGGVYYSTNGGSYWQRSIVDSALTYPYFNSVSSSADGSTVFVTQQVGNLYVSRNFAYTFSKASTPSNLFWMGVASSANGQYAVALSSDLYFSSNYGSNWSKASAPSGNWYTAHFSLDGSHVYAAAAGSYGDYAYGGIYISSDQGRSWTLSPSSNRSLKWRLVTSDQSGQNVFAVVEKGDVYSSSDYGKTFVQSTTTPSGESWRAITSDAQGQHLTLASYNTKGFIYYSLNGL